MTSPRARRGDAEPRAEPGAAQKPPSGSVLPPRCRARDFFPSLSLWPKAGAAAGFCRGSAVVSALSSCFVSAAFCSFYFFPFFFFWGVSTQPFAPSPPCPGAGAGEPQGSCWGRGGHLGPRAVVPSWCPWLRAELVAPRALFSRKGATRIGIYKNYQDDAGEVGWTLLCAVVATSPPRVAKAHMAAHTPAGGDSPLARCLLRNITFYLFILEMQTPFAPVLSLPNSSSRS